MDESAARAELERLARDWTSATDEARFALYGRAIRGDPSAPPLRELQLAIYLAEASQGSIAEG